MSAAQMALIFGALHRILKKNHQERDATMKKETFFIPNISCGHCVNSIQSELTEIEGVVQVQGDAHSKKVTVMWDAPATLEKIRETLNEINYPIV